MGEVLDVRSLMLHVERQVRAEQIIVVRVEAAADAHALEERVEADDLQHRLAVGGDLLMADFGRVEPRPQLLERLPRAE